MFSKQDKKKIATDVLKLLRETGNPELPMGPITFTLLVVGRHVSTSCLIKTEDAGIDPLIAKEVAR